MAGKDKSLVRHRQEEAGLTGFGHKLGRTEQHQPEGLSDQQCETAESS